MTKYSFSSFSWAGNASAGMFMLEFDPCSSTFHPLFQPPSLIFFHFNHIFRSNKDPSAPPHGLLPPPGEAALIPPLAPWKVHPVDSQQTNDLEPWKISQNPIQIHWCCLWKTSSDYQYFFDFLPKLESLKIIE